jgi:hypothetical protein
MWNIARVKVMAKLVIFIILAAFFVLIFYALNSFASIKGELIIIRKWGKKIVHVPIEDVTWLEYNDKIKVGLNGYITTKNGYHAANIGHEPEEFAAEVKKINPNVIVQEQKFK